MTVAFTIKGGVARVTIDRPDRMNAVDLATSAELERVWTAIAADESVRCVVLTGAGNRARFVFARDVFVIAGLVPAIRFAAA